MTVVSVKTEADGDLRRVEFSDGSLLSFRICYLPPSFTCECLSDPDMVYGAADGLELSLDEAEDLRFAASCFRAEKTALRLIARAEQTVFGLRRKLEKRGAGAACATAVILRLCDLDLLDDRRYARLWLESRVDGLRVSSPMRMLAALRARGVDRDDAESALRDVLDDDAERRLLERFLQKLQRKRKIPGWRSGDGDDFRRSLKYLLRGEGFSSPAIEQLFDENAL